MWVFFWSFLFFLFIFSLSLLCFSPALLHSSFGTQISNPIDYMLLLNAWCLVLGVWCLVLVMMILFSLIFFFYIISVFWKRCASQTKNRYLCLYCVESKDVIVIWLKWQLQQQVERNQYNMHTAYRMHMVFNIVSIACAVKLMKQLCAVWSTENNFIHIHIRDEPKTVSFLYFRLVA